MKDLSKPILLSYREKVLDIYKVIEREPWCNLVHFEHCLRRISILNAKIKSIRKAIRTSELQQLNKDE